MEEVVSLTAEQAARVAKELDRHTKEAPGLFFHKQDSAADGMQLVVCDASGQVVWVMPPRVLDDGGASCNLITATYADLIGAQRVPVRSALTGSVGASTAITEAVWADVVVAAGTPHQQTAKRQLFFVVDSSRLYDVLIGNGMTKFGPLRSHVDGIDHRYYYTTAMGHRHSLPMVTRRKSGGPSAAHASAGAAAQLFALACGGASSALPRES